MLQCTIFYLISRIRAQHIQRRRDQLGANGYGVVTLLFSGAKCLLDRIDAGRSITGQFNIGSELDWLGGKSSRDGRHKE